MPSINKSFLYGIGFASLTWTVSLYLYLQLNKSDINPTATPNEGSQLRLKGEKANRYQNPDHVISALQPVLKKADDLDELGLVKNSGDQKIRNDGYKVHAFNILVSNQLSYHRTLPDTRNKLCKSLKYADNLPTASVIICFYNEHLQTLLRTIHSIVDRTPGSLLKEIVLVDDFSDISNLHSNITAYLDKNFDAKIKIYKTERREGLIRARIFGAQHAKGDVITFLDSHVEVNADWLQPLLARIKEDKRNVVMPVIDIINPDTFTYTSSPLVRGGFNWGLHFKWENLPKGTLSADEDFVKPIKSPTMAGGLFAMNRKYFFDLGEYDAGMNVWGGENLEISFRIWMCGGNLEIVPCSRVGHIFRHRRPYGSPNGQDTMLYNSLRVAHVWLDDYKEYFLKHRKEAANTKFGDVSSRIQLRKELKCQDFDWYIKNVYPELTLPTDDEERLKNKWAALEKDKFQPWHSRRRNYVGNYMIRLSNTSLCMQSKQDVKSKGSSLVLQSCLRTKSQMWYETDKSELVLGQMLCLQGSKKAPYLYKCHEMGGDQEWKHRGDRQTPIYNLAAGTCLGAKGKTMGAQVYMTLCSGPDFNTWDLVR